MMRLLILSYAAVAIGMTLVTLDLRAQGVTTITALRTHMHTFRIITVLGASAALLGHMGTLVVATTGLIGDPMMLIAALPALAAFYWGVKTLTPV